MISGVCSIKSYLEEDVLRQKYLVEELSIRKISEDLMCSKSTVVKYLQLYNIRSRKRGSTEISAPNPRYGERRYGNKIVINSREKKVIDLITQLHKKGFSNRAIGRVLD